MKKVYTIGGWLLAILLFFIFTKDFAVKLAVQSGVQAVTGLKLGIRSFSLELHSSVVSIKGLKLYNPAGYRDRIMLDMPEIYVDYELRPLFQNILHIEEMRIDLSELAVVKGKDGKVNLEALKQDSGGPLKLPQMQIDSLDLKIGKAVFKDYSAGPEPTVKEFDINASEHYSNIKNPYVLVSLVVFKTLAKTSIAQLADYDTAALKTLAAQAVSTGIMQGIQNAAQGIKNLFH